MADKSVTLDDIFDQENASKPESIQDGMGSGITRSGLIESLGISVASGDLIGDLKSSKRVLLERGISIKRAQAEPDMGEGIVQFIASTEGVKRDGNRVRNDGWSFENFSKNPQFLWCHDYSSLPIGKHVDWRVEKVDGEPVLRLWSQFCSEDLYPFADKVRKMYEQGFLRAGSIGWIPLKYETIVDKNGYTVGFDFLENDLLEFSAVPVPSDPNALIEAVQRGVLSSEDMEKLVRNRKNKDDFNVAYRLSNQDHSSKEDFPLDSREIEEDIFISNSEEMESIPLSEEYEGSNQFGLECASSDAEEVMQIGEEQEILLSAETIDEDRLEDISSRSNYEMDESEEDENGKSVKDKLLYVIEKASKDFTYSIVSAVMEVVESDGFGEVEEEDKDQADDAPKEDGQVEDRASEEEAPELDDEFVNLAAEEAASITSDRNVQGRIGAKVSRENKDRLCRCRDMLKDVVSEIDKMMEEKGMMEDSEKDGMEVEIPEEDDTTMSLDEDPQENSDWLRAIDLASSISRQFSKVEKEEKAVTEESPKIYEISDLATAARSILESISLKLDGEKSDEVKSKYLQNLIKKSKA